MKKFKEKGFTLIELIAVLVIMAVLTLIVTPLVMNIIRRSRVSADRRSVDAYGRSIELAIAGYLMDTGSFPTSIEQLTIEYSGDEVVCSTTQLKSDSSVYLAGCTVAGRSTGDYTYGKGETAQTYTAYQVGDEVSYNNIDYYVIKDSGTSDSTVTLLKAEPLTAEEITTYSAGTGAQTDGNGGIQYHSSSNAYSTSYIKTTINAWAQAKVPSKLAEARLITIDELINNLGYEYYEEGSNSGYRSTEFTPNWVYNNNYWYWTMSSYRDSTDEVWYPSEMMSYSPVNVGRYGFGISDGKVRPVIVLDKSVL